MLQNAKVAAFTVSEFLRENHQGEGNPHTHQIWISDSLLNKKKSQIFSLLESLLFVNQSKALKNIM